MVLVVLLVLIACHSRQVCLCLVTHFMLFFSGWVHFGAFLVLERAGTCDCPLNEAVLLRTLRWLHRVAHQDTVAVKKTAKSPEFTSIPILSQVVLWESAQSRPSKPHFLSFPKPKSVSSRVINSEGVVPDPLVLRTATFHITNCLIHIVFQSQHILPFP